MKQYDLVVIGAGPGGTPAAMMAARFGKKVLLIDKRGEPGGECLFEGCIPSKILENAANRYALLKEARSFHIDLDGAAQIHWEEVIADKDVLLEQRAQAALASFKVLPSLDFLAGETAFVDAHTIEVNGERYGFEHAIVATGASAHIPPLKGEGVSRAWTNADIFKAKELPEEIAFIGAGAISCELVQMFAKLGVKCHILERGPRILKRIDEEAALIVQKRMQEQGIEVLLNVGFDSIDGDEGDFTIRYTQEGAAKTLRVPHLLIATGRAANVEGIGLEKAGVEFDRHGIKVDGGMQSTVPHIYAVGDCAVGPKFAHWATYTAGVAIHNIYAPTRHEAQEEKLSWVLFSDPQIASAGLSEAEAAQKGLEVSVEKYDYAADARAQIDKDAEGFIKFVVETKSGVIKGVQVVSYDASSLAGEASLIVANAMTVLQVMGAIHPHPTLTEGFGKLAQSLFFKSMMNRRR
ncbi:dihydrolipoyl dehydrogenase family protein [Nitratifractor salsuginis]|uniref:FAD-dependent pyridine nucleotide-disulfide oxidoreductase n=1 Tax=Nitratifractor salsuginis (strain DSM 16511 / JCM 12458 / E9I37-1) TaxID=749222 RepID=E6X3F2_NITSE|nr:NAD(P)/FAD-dependent oxidoreductase [Nitratifractor salsuginis]ADV46229.1 FAD-dependent pyridine nucleotide-disulfide oxidoreductase [Nitratifractor salsuginis DSM 16511]